MLQRARLQFIIPIVFDLVFSGFIVIIITKRIEKHYIIMGDIKNQIQELKTLIIHMQSQMIADHKDAIKQFFMISGHLQVYIEDYKNYMLGYNKKMKTDFFLLNKLEKIIQETINSGIAMNCLSK